MAVTSCGYGRSCFTQRPQDAGSSSGTTKYQRNICTSSGTLRNRSTEAVPRARSPRRSAVRALQHAVLGAFLEHHVLVFRGQSLDRAQQLAFTLQFGELEDHVGRLQDAERYSIVHTVSNLDRDGRPSTAMTRGGNYHWHTDKSY